MKNTMQDWNGILRMRPAAPSAALALAAVPLCKPFAKHNRDFEKGKYMNKLLKVTVLALAVASFSVYSGAQESQETLATKHVLEGTYNKEANSAVARADSAPTGTKDYIPLWLSSTKVGISNMFQSGGDIGVGTTTPGATLDVNGSINADTGFNLGGSSFAFGSLGEGNAFLGFAGNTTTTGTDNTATGAGALQKNTSGSANNGYGQAALVNNSSGNDNAAFGTNALFNLTTGSENTAIGVDALEASNGTDLTCVGFDCTAAEENIRNATAIGAHAFVSVSDAVVLGSIAGVNGASATARVGIGTAEPTNLLTLGRGFGPSIADGWSTYSSRRWKTNIQTLHGALEKVERLRGVSYDLKANGQHEVGVIAEEVGAVVPELVTYEANGKDARGVDYSRLTALLIEATKEQQALIRHQEKLIRAQQAEIRAAQIQNTAQQAQISQLASQVHTIQVSLATGQQRGFEVRTASLRTNSRQ
jgi:hypothetical protein